MPKYLTLTYPASDNKTNSMEFSLYTCHGLFIKCYFVSTSLLNSNRIKSDDERWHGILNIFFFVMNVNVKISSIYLKKDRSVRNNKHNVSFYYSGNKLPPSITESERAIYILKNTYIHIYMCVYILFIYFLHYIYTHIYVMHKICK